MKQFKFFTPVNIQFGNNAFEKTANTLKNKGIDSVLIVTDPGLKAVKLPDQLMLILKKSGIDAIMYDQVKVNPTILNVKEGSALVKAHKVKAVIGLGGGSSLDAAKSISAMSVNPGSILDYELGHKSFAKRGPLIVAIPTTAGTGSEATMAAVISDEKTHRKFDVVSDLIAPSYAFVDPELTLSLPPSLTAETGMDALTHAVEGYTATLANDITDAIHIKAIALLGKYLPIAFHDGKSYEAREQVMKASLMAGIAFPNSGLGAVHGLSYPLSGHYGISHGRGNAMLLPFVLSFNLPAVGQRAVDIANALGSATQNPDDAVKRIMMLNEELGIPKLSTYSIAESMLAVMATESIGPFSNCNTNPIEITVESGVEIYRKALSY